MIYCRAWTSYAHGDTRKNASGVVAVPKVNQKQARAMTVELEGQRVREAIVSPGGNLTRQSAVCDALSSRQ